jgi:glycosyltransferase involved in cell wall biosynthesis
VYPNRVLLVHNHYRQAGGEDRVFAAEGALLSRFGHQVSRYTANNSDIHGAGSARLAAQALWNPGARARLADLLRETRPEVVHLHNTFPLLSPSVYYAAKRQGAAVVQSLHNYRLLCPGANLFRDGRVCEECVGCPVPWRGALHACYRNSRRASAATAAMLAVHRLMGTWTRMVDVFVALTEFARDKFVEAGFPAERIAVKPNFADPDPGRGTGRGAYALFVGRLSPEKGVGTLLDAWRRASSPVSLRIVGDGPLAGEARQRTHRSPNVDVLGPRANDEVCRLMGDAAFLVLPSECYEAFPLVAVEAFARGTPVVASNLGAMAEVIEDGRTGLLFRPGDAEDLAAKVDWMAAHPAEVRRMREEARAEFLAKYTAERNYTALMEIYERAIERRAAGIEPRAAAAQAAGHAG